MTSNAPFTVPFAGHLLDTDRRVLASTPIYDYAAQLWDVGHDHAHYADADCEGPMLLCRVSAGRCPEFVAEWSYMDAAVAAYDLDVYQATHADVVTV